jgi:hypothetical protein
VAETITTTSLNDAMKIVWAPRQRKQFNDTHFLYQKLRGAVGRWTLGGRAFEGSVKKRGSGSWRTLQEQEQLPRAGSPAYDLYQMSTKIAASTYRISEQSMKASKGNEKAWVDGRMDAADSTVSQFAQRLSQMFYRDGTGKVARVDTGNIAITDNGNGTWTIGLDANMSSGSGNTFGLDFLQEEMHISASADTTGTLAERTFDGRIISIDTDNIRLTLDGQIGDLANNDYIYIGDKARTSKNRDWMGLLGIVDNGTIVDTLQNISRASNNFWKASRYANVGAADLENQFQTASDDITKKGLGKIDAIITTFGVRKRMANDMKGDRRFIAAAESGDYKGGFSSVKWMDGNNRAVEIWVDKDCPAGTAFLLNWDALHLAWLQEPTWWDAGGGVLQRVDDTLTLQAVYYAMGNLGTDQPNTLAVCLGITED